MGNLLNSVNQNVSHQLTWSLVKLSNPWLSAGMICVYTHPSKAERPKGPKVINYRVLNAIFPEGRSNDIASGPSNFFYIQSSIYFGLIEASLFPLADKTQNPSLEGIIVPDLKQIVEIQPKNR